MAETRNFVIVGGSAAGLAIAHSFLKHIEPGLKSLGKSYHLYIVDSSSHFFWNVGSPRSLVSDTLLPSDKLFAPIADGFKSYDSSLYTIIHGTVNSWNVEERTIKIKPASHEAPQMLPYHALVLSTGLRTPSPATSLRGNYTVTQAAIAALNKKLASATSVVISGGGPTGVEIAGETGYFLNGTAGWFNSRPSQPKAKVTIVTKADRLLPVLSSHRAKVAETYLNRVGVDVEYNTSVESSTTNSDGTTTLNLSNGEQWTTDVYIPAGGAVPNSAFVPAILKNDRGYIKANKTTLRVDSAGPHVYVFGDVGDYSRGGFHNLYSALPDIVTNIKRDLLAAAASDEAYPTPEGLDRLFPAIDSETQVVPIGPKGVGAVNGWYFPSILIWLLKGRDYMIANIPAIVQGHRFAKET